MAVVLSLDVDAHGATVFTVGHSTHDEETFVSLLQRNGITAVVDVRSVPYSRYADWFNKDHLRGSLGLRGIAYVFLGDSLGARPSDPTCCVDGTVDYERVARTESFRQGLQRVIRGSKRYSIALLCTEKDPIACHRNILVARALQQVGATIRHILADGSIEENAQTERRLVKATGLEQTDLFSAASLDPVDEAYRVRGRQIANRDDETTEDVESSSTGSGDPP